MVRKVMEMFVDTHAHIYLDHFTSDLDDVLQRARGLGVERIYMPNVDASTIDAMLAVEAVHPTMCRSMMGLHPCSVGPDYRSALDTCSEWLERRHFVAIGEIGIDLYWDKSYVVEQEEAFRVQIEWARAMKRPFVVHSRDSLDMTISIVTEMQHGDLTGIFHCFTGSVDQAKRIIDIGFHLGIGGVSTFKNGGLRDILKDIPLSACVLETDAPYLTPSPYRGKRNSPEYIPIMAQTLAETHDISVEEVGKITTENAKKIYIEPPIRSEHTSE